MSKAKGIGRFRKWNIFLTRRCIERSEGQFFVEGVGPIAKQAFDPEFMSRTKRAMISAANAALDYKTKNPKLSDNEVLTHIIAHLEEILRGLQE